MEVRYHNTREDHAAYHDWLWSAEKASQESEYWHRFFWYMAVLILGVYTAAKNGEGFIVCLFCVLAVYFIAGNRSYEKRWAEEMKARLHALPEDKIRVVFDDQGFTMYTRSYELRVPWSEVQGYDKIDARIFIKFLNRVALTIPLRDLSAGEGDELIALLAKYRINELGAGIPAR